MLFPKLENSEIVKLTIKYLLPLWFPWVWSPHILNKKFAPETKAEREATFSISGCFEVNGVRLITSGTVNQRARKVLYIYVV